MAKSKHNKGKGKSGGVTGAPNLIPMANAPSINPALTGVQGSPAALTPQDIRRAANAQVDMQTRPTLTALDTQRQQTQVQGKGIQDRLIQMYGNLSQSIGNELPKIDAAGAQSQQAFRGIGQAAQDAITNSYQQADGRMAADGGRRGAGLDGGASKALASQAALVHANAAADTSFASMAAQQQQDAYRGLVESMAQTAKMHGTDMAGQAGLETSKTLGDIQGKRDDVLAQRGPLRAKAVTDLTQQAFNNYATVQGLNLKGDAQAIQLALGTANNALGYDRLNSTIADDNVDNNISQQNADTAKERNAIAWGNLGTAQDKLAWQKSHAAYIDSHGGVKGMTPYQRAQFQKANSAVRGQIKSVGDVGDAFHQQMVKGDDGKMHHYTQAQIRAALLKKFGNDADIVNAGIALAHNTLNEGAHPELIQALKARHIGIPKEWTRTKGYTGAKGN
jgi:hypothetical protein